MPTTTPRGYPYPLPTEPVAEGAQAIRNLAEKIDAAGGSDLIQRIQLAAAGTFNFTSIPDKYEHLKLVGSLRSMAAGANDYAALTFNAEATAGYRYQQFLSAGATAYHSEGAPATKGRCALCPAAGSAANIFSTLDLLIPCYRSGLLRAWQASGFTMFGTNLGVFQIGGFYWSTPVLTSLQLVAETSPGTFAVGSVLSLYGIK